MKTAALTGRLAVWKEFWISIPDDTDAPGGMQAMNDSRHSPCYASNGCIA